MSPRSWLSARGAAAWIIALLVGAFVVRNFEYIMEQRDWHTVADSFVTAAGQADLSLLFTSITNFMISDFMIGFACAALLFALWDTVHRIRPGKRKTAATNLIAQTTSSVEASQLIFEHSPAFVHHRAGEEGKPWVTFRIRLSDTIVNKTNPYLLAVRRYENGEWSHDKLSGAKPMLSWIGSGNRFAPRAVHGEEYILLLDYDVTLGTLSFVVDRKHTPFSIRYFVNNIPHGKYLLEVGVPGDAGGMIKRAFMLDWFGDSDSISLQLST